MQMEPFIYIILFIVGFIILIKILRDYKRKKINEKMSAWLNHNKNELLNSWGPPSSVFKNDDGSEIWSYNKIGQTPGYAYRVSKDFVNIEPGQQYTITRQFYINKNGIIYNFRWEN